MHARAHTCTLLPISCTHTYPLISHTHPSTHLSHTHTPLPISHVHTHPFTHFMRPHTPLSTHLMHAHTYPCAHLSHTHPSTHLMHTCTHTPTHPHTSAHLAIHQSIKHSLDLSAFFTFLDSHRGFTLCREAVGQNQLSSPGTVSEYCVIREVCSFQCLGFFFLMLLKKKSPFKDQESRLMCATYLLTCI